MKENNSSNLKLGHLTFNMILSLKNTEISMLPYLLKLYSSVKVLICRFEISLLQYQIPTIWTIYNLNYFKNNEGKKGVKRNECQRRWLGSFDKIFDRRELGLSSGGVKWREDGTCFWRVLEFLFDNWNVLWALHTTIAIHVDNESFNWIASKFSA